MSEASSQASAASTSDSNEPECTSPGNAKPTASDAPCSQPDSPESSAPQTFVRSTRPHGPVDSDLNDERWERADTHPTLTPDATTQNVLVFRLSGDYEDPSYIIDDVPMLTANPMSDRLPLIFSAEASPAKTSASPDAAPDSTAPDQASSSSSHESLTLFSPLEDGSSLRTFPDYFPQTVDAITPSYSRRWPNSGFTTSPGESWTADTSESPNAGAASTSLRDVLEATVPAKYYLSPRAAQGILRRAEKRGRQLPQHLADALQAVSTTKEAGS